MLKSKSVPKTALEAIKLFVKQMIAMFNDGNLENLLAIITDDAVIMPSNEPKISGKEAISAWTKSFLAPFKNYHLICSIEEIQVAGNWAFIIGQYRLTLTPKAEGEVIYKMGNFIDILDQQPNGDWKLAREIFNSDQPLSDAQ
ncbi:MAG: nuclear transport factor 2 family protein [Xenococcus sp. MO_188.B8]|nr:nuclear transport factor 2 family protein [Xenococcus sp. MO_188.B8]